MALVLRYDLASFSPRTTRTPQGFIKIPAFFTRAGVFEYDRADGTKVLELRPASEVFHKDSLATLSSAPVVEDHPAEGMVTKDNAKMLTIGWSSEVVERKDSMVSGSVLIMDGASIDKVARGDLKEISMGYQCRVDATPGIDPEHGRYDQVQRDIRYNHVALGGVDWGRAGSEVGLRLDASTAIGTDKWAQDGTDLEGLAKTPKPNIESCQRTRVDTAKDRSMETMTFKIGGVEFEVPKAAGQAFLADQTRRDAEVTALQTKADKAEARADAVKAELETTKTALTEATDPTRLDEAIASQVKLVQDARKILGPDAELPKTRRETMEAVLRHDKKDANFEGKSDDYVEVRFDHLVEITKAPAAVIAPMPGAGQVALVEGARQDSRSKAVIAQEKMRERNSEAWKEPLAFNRS